MSLEGSFPEGHPGPSRIAGRFRRWPVEDVLAYLGAPAGATARADGSADLTFEGRARAGHADLTLSAARLGEASFDAGAFRAALDGWRLSVGPIPDRRGSRRPQGRRRQAATSRKVAAVSIEALGASPGRAAVGADLGGSRKYSNENFED